MAVFTRWISFSALALLLAGCASTPDAPLSPGQRITERGDAISEYGDAWTSGQANVTEGQRMVERSARDSRDAQEKLTSARGHVVEAETRLREAEAVRIAGERLIADGQLQMQRAEADYAAIRSGPAATLGGGSR